MAKARQIEGLTPDLPFAKAAAMTVRVRVDELFAIDAARVMDTADIEQVHDMRVATRRLRAVLEVYGACFDADALKPVLRDVKALADALGARRDPDVQLDALADLRDELAPQDAAGVEVVAEEARLAQALGNQVLAAALEAVAASDLHGRLLALAATADAEAPAEVEA